MYDPPAYLWAITIAGPAAVAALTCIVLYGGAERAGLGRRRAALLAGAAAVLLGGWLTATAVIAGHGWYHTLPWLPVAVTGYLGLLLALSRIPVVARALAAPGMASRLELPHTPRVAGVAFLLYMALGHLPALFALPAGPYRCCSPCTSRPRSRSPEPHDQRRQPPARSFPAPRPAPQWRQARHPAPGENTQPEEKTMQLEIDALKEAAWPGADRHTPRRARQPGHGRRALPGGPSARTTVRRA